MGGRIKVKAILEFLVLMGMDIPDICNVINNNITDVGYISYYNCGSGKFEIVSSFGWKFELET